MSKTTPPTPWNQPLFSHMAENHWLTLLESEMDEIIRVVREITHPELPMLGDCHRVRREEIMSALQELKQLAYAFQRSEDPAFVRFPDLELILDYVETFGLPPKH